VGGRLSRLHEKHWLVHLYYVAPESFSFYCCLNANVNFYVIGQWKASFIWSNNVRANHIAPNNHQLAFQRKMAESLL